MGHSRDRVLLNGCRHGVATEIDNVFHGRMEANVFERLDRLDTSWTLDRHVVVHQGVDLVSNFDTELGVEELFLELRHL